VRKELVSGKKVKLADGRRIDPEDVLGPPRRGTRFMHVGDCGSTKELLPVARGVDALVIEATYLSFEADLAAQFGHLTAADAAGLARDADVGQLFLTHISRRYRERDIQTEAEAIFPRVSVARDFDHFEVRRRD